MLAALNREMTDRAYNLQGTVQSPLIHLEDRT